MQEEPQFYFDENSFQFIGAVVYSYWFLLQVVRISDRHPNIMCCFSRLKADIASGLNSVWSVFCHFWMNLSKFFSSWSGCGVENNLLSPMSPSFLKTRLNSLKHCIAWACFLAIIFVQHGIGLTSQIHFDLAHLWSCCEVCCSRLCKQFSIFQLIPQLKIAISIRFQQGPFL